jgi:conjugative transposon traM protein
MKKIDFKKINFKDKKFIFPLIFALPILFIGYMIYGIVTDSSTATAEQTQVDQEEISNVPVADSVSIASKFEAIDRAYRDQQDFTAIQSEQEKTLLQADTTIYTLEERALIAQLEEEQKLADAKIAETNSRIREANSTLNSERTSQAQIPSRNSSHEESNLNKEIMMYQKILRGEEILTPEEEEKRKIEAIKAEERAKVLREVSKQSTSIVEKVVNNPSQTAFNTIGKQTENNTYIRAMVDQGVVVTSGSRIRFRLLDEIKIQGELVPAGSLIYALVTSFGEQRVHAEVTSIITKGKRVKVRLSVYDRDGIQGFFIPKSSFRDLQKQAGSRAMSNSHINISNNSETLEGVALQTLQGVYQSASTAISQKIQENKAKIKYNTIIYLINDNE